MRQNIAGWCHQTFCSQKYIDNAQQCLAFTSQANFPAHILNFHWGEGDGIKFRIPFKIFYTLSVPEISQITGTLMPDTNPEIIKNSLLYDFTEVVRCEDCDSVLDQNLSYFYLKCLLRKLDCFSEVLRSSCLRDDHFRVWKKCTL